MLSFDDNVYRTSHKKYFFQTVEIKNCKVMIDRESFFNQPTKNGRKSYKNIRKTATGHVDKYTTGWLLDSPCSKNNYKLILIDLCK